MNKTKKLIVISLILLVACGCIAFTSFLVFFPLSPVNTFYNLTFAKEVSGYVYDCETGEKVDGVNITMRGTGWGKRDGYVWDKEYLSEVMNKADGSFRLRYNIGTELSAEKEGYLEGRSYSGPEKDIKLGLVKKNSDNMDESYTYNCVLGSECLQSKVKDGIEGSYNKCSNPELGE